MGIPSEADFEKAVKSYKQVATVTAVADEDFHQVSSGTPKADNKGNVPMKKFPGTPQPEIDDQEGGWSGTLFLVAAVAVVFGLFKCCSSTPNRAFLLGRPFSF